ncbi:MAG TPA: hypothetical protein VJ866_09285 [Pyrinomonadaceae bacterium]|nr:hypothetical protein [Pyrinomonadaceae bacterium]
MAGPIHLDSVESLEDLCLALAAFASGCADGVEAGEADIARRGELLEERCRELARRVEYWQEEYDRADEDDDLGYIARRLRDAEESYERARAWLRRAEEAAAEYARAAARARDLSDRRIPEACAFLRQKVSELREYAAAQPRSAAPGGALAGQMPTPPPAADNSAAGGGSLTDFPLPSGFKWVKLDEIAPQEMEELPTPDDFRKVPYEVMRDGLEVLRGEVLPAISKLGAGADRDYFRQLDAANGDDPQRGALKVFDSFFGSEFKEYARVERFAGSPHYSITNGRHRIKVALDLGWDAVPAEAVEVERRN